MTSAAHLLVVDDDARLRDLLRRFLVESGFLITTVSDAREARAALASFSFDLVILDVMLPGESGLDLTRSLSSSEVAVPILLLTARGEPEDRVAGLELGAEDYLGKPFEPRELVLRVERILRRRASEALANDGPVQFGGFVFDHKEDMLRRDGEPVRLTATEKALLRALAARPGQALSREELSRLLGAGNDRTIDVQVTRLRRKIEPDPRFPRYLQTVWGRGYLLRPD